VDRTRGGLPAQEKRRRAANLGGEEKQLEVRRLSRCHARSAFGGLGLRRRPSGRLFPARITTSPAAIHGLHLLVYYFRRARFSSISLVGKHIYLILVNSDLRICINGENWLGTVTLAGQQSVLFFRRAKLLLGFSSQVGNLK